MKPVLGRGDDRQPPLRTSHLRCRDPGAGIAPLLGTLAIEGRTHARRTDSAARVHPARLPTLRLVDGRILPALGRSASRLLVPAGRGRMDAPRQHVDRLAWATPLLLVAVLTYQPAAMFFWVFLAVALVGAVADSARALRLARVHFAVAAVAAGIAFLVYKLGIRLIGEDAIGRSRCPHGRRRRQGRVVLALGSLRVAEPLRRDVVGLAGSSRGHRRRRGHRALPLRRASRPMLYIALGSSCSCLPSCRTSWSRRPTNSRSTERWCRSRR